MKIGKFNIPLPQIYVKMSIQSLAAFCGSYDGADPEYSRQALQLGTLMAAHNVTLIYGGGNVGIMGVIANSVIDGGGKVVGVIPKVLVERERQHNGISQLIVAEDMHERKRTIYSLCDAAIVLPGGFGTMDEFFEMITWNQLSIHDKEIFILNTAGYYDHLMAHIKKMQDEKFLYEAVADRIIVLNNPVDILPFFNKEAK